MKIEFVNRSQKAIENSDYRNAVEIYIDDKIAFSVGDGEPEDSNLSRDFSDVFSIPNLMRRAWEAGKRGEKFEYTEREDDDI